MDARVRADRQIRSLGTVYTLVERGRVNTPPRKPNRKSGVAHSFYWLLVLAYKSSFRTGRPATRPRPV
jgi:hypothetical protein